MVSSLNEHNDSGNSYSNTHFCSNVRNNHKSCSNRNSHDRHNLQMVFVGWGQICLVKWDHAVLDLLTKCDVARNACQLGCVIMQRCMF